MSRLAAVVLGASVALAACESLEPPERLMFDLQAVGHPAALGTSFDGLLLGGDGTVVCAGAESVQVYVFGDIDSAIDAAATIDRDDPSSIGNGIVEWRGPPRFWLRDRAIIGYVGHDEAVDAALRGILGQPFAESDDPGRELAGPRPPCVRAG